MVGDATSWVQARLIPFVGTFIWSGCSHAVLHPMSPDGVCACLRFRRRVVLLVVAVVLVLVVGGW